MTITISPGTQDFEFTVSPLAELVASLHLLAEPDHHEARGTWIAQAHDRLDDSLLKAISRTDYLWRVSRPAIFLPSVRRASLDDELDGIDALSDEDWVSSVLLTSSCGTIQLRTDLGSPLVDERARDLARERAAVRGARASSFVEEVLADPEAARRAVRTVISDYDAQFFRGAWSQLGPHLTAEARGRSDVLATVGIEPTLAGMSHHLAYADGQVIVDKLQDARTTGDGTGLTFLPTFLGDPHILVTYAPRRRPVVQYPIQRAISADEVGLDTIQARLRALDHPLRLRLLRSLVRAPRSTAELADAWAVSPPEVSRHLAALLEAHLVTTRREGRFVLYSADTVALQRLGSDLLTGLLR
ncbi:ArsR/SmtB family transcription factor [Gryllotalpicola koreensis]